jgi:hypothetical protein
MSKEYNWLPEILVANTLIIIIRIILKDRFNDQFDQINLKVELNNNISYDYTHGSRI